MTDPIDETQPHPDVDPTARQGPDGSPATPPADGAATTPEADPAPPLQAKPDRPADSGWREPAWFPPRDHRASRDRDRRPGIAALIVGLALIAIGGYYFLDRTLGIAMPRIQWSSLWPVVLIVIGVIVLIRSLQRRA